MMEWGVPFHRSLVFWCGFVVFAFLVWSWWDSMRWMTRVRSDFMGPPRQVQVMTVGGSVDLIVAYLDDGLRGDLWEVDSERLGGGAGRDSWWGLKNGPRFGLDGDGRFGQASVPHWLLVACLLPPWLGVSVWRVRRRRHRDR